MKVPPTLFDGLNNKECETFMRRFTQIAWNNRQQQQWWWDNFSEVKFSFSIHNPYSKYTPTPSISFINHLAEKKRIVIPFGDEYSGSKHFHHQTKGFILVKKLDLSELFEEAFKKIIHEQRQFSDARHPQQLVQKAIYADIMNGFPITRHLVSEIQRKKLQKLTNNPQSKQIKIDAL